MMIGFAGVLRNCVRGMPSPILKLVLEGDIIIRDSEG